MLGYTTAGFGSKCRTYSGHLQAGALFDRAYIVQIRIFRMSEWAKWGTRVRVILKIL
jgi:hypothetical protein